LAALANAIVELPFDRGKAPSVRKATEIENIEESRTRPASAVSNYVENFADWTSAI